MLDINFCNFLFISLKDQGSNSEIMLGSADHPQPQAQARQASNMETDTETEAALRGLNSQI